MPPDVLKRPVHFIDNTLQFRSVLSPVVSNCRHMRNLYIVVYKSFMLHVSLMPSIKKDISSLLSIHVDQAKLVTGVSLNALLYRILQ